MSIARYFELLERYPELSKEGGAQSIRTLTDRTEIQREQQVLRRRLIESGKSAAWRDVGLLPEDDYRIFVRDVVKFPDGRVGFYLRLINRRLLSGGVGVVIPPVFQGRIGILRNFRHATRAWELEVPRGFGEIGLSPEENAKKELKEETGLVASKLVGLGRMHTDTGVTSNCVELFLAETESDRTDIYTGEAIVEMIWMSPNEFEEMVRTNGITDAFSIVAYAKARLQRLIWEMPLVDVKGTKCSMIVTYSAHTRLICC